MPNPVEPNAYEEISAANNILSSDDSSSYYGKGNHPKNGASGNLFIDTKHSGLLTTAMSAKEKSFTLENNTYFHSQCISNDFNESIDMFDETFQGTKIDSTQADYIEKSSFPHSKKQQMKSDFEKITHYFPAIKSKNTEISKITSRLNRTTVAKLKKCYSHVKEEKGRLKDIIKMSNNNLERKIKNCIESNKIPPGICNKSNIEANTEVSCSRLLNQSSQNTDSTFRFGEIVFSSPPKDILKTVRNLRLPCHDGNSFTEKVTQSLCTSVCLDDMIAGQHDLNLIESCSYENTSQNMYSQVYINQFYSVIRDE